MFDQQAEMRRLKWLLIVGGVFLIATYYAWGELKFAVWGKTAAAVVTRTHEFTEYGRGSHNYVSVEYRFSDAAGNSLSEKDRIPADSGVDLETGDTIAVQYIPGSPDSSRMVGNSHKGWVYVFLACVGVIGFMIFRLWREARG